MPRDYAFSGNEFAVSCQRQLAASLQGINGETIAMSRLSLMIATLLLHFAGASAAEPMAGDELQKPWTWIWVERAPTGWQTRQGEIEFGIEGNHFVMTLAIPPKVPDGTNHPPFPTLRVVGNISGKHVTITATRLNTDAGPVHLTGTITSIRTKRSNPSNGWGEDLISVSNAWMYIAFHRAVRSAH